MKTLDDTVSSYEIYQELISELHHLQQANYALECSDDYLFTNLNGNRNLWEERNQRIKEIHKELEEMGCTP